MPTVIEVDEPVELSQTHVLLVDDSDDNRMLVSRMLKAAGARVTEACNGREAIDVASRSNFSVVLMDVQMPVVDGLTATEELRKLGYAGPILSLTAHALEEERRACIAAGCDGHLTKPVNKNELLQVVSHWTTHSSRYASIH
ncbi:MAG: response regulator [Proteobacteria bacterium]|nr:MAG: response regulator [Pseudomonadota bacterium]